MASERILPCRHDIRDPRDCRHDHSVQHDHLLDGRPDRHARQLLRVFGHHDAVRVHRSGWLGLLQFIALKLVENETKGCPTKLQEHNALNTSLAWLIYGCLRFLLLYYLIVEEIIVSDYFESKLKTVCVCLQHSK